MQRICPHFVLVLIVSLLAGCGPKPEAAPPAPPVVLVTEAVPADIPIFNEAIATLDGTTNTPIHSQVTGYLIKQAYQEGSVVNPGDLLFQIDPRPFQADLDKAQAKLQVNNLSAQASVVTAATNLGCTQITAPISGVAGRAIPGVGDLINPSMTLTTISTVDPIQAEFTLPAQFYLDHADSLARATSIPIAARPESLELILADGASYPHQGKWDHVNRPVPTGTGPITATALFPNPDRLLRPGQYAKVRGIAPKITGAVLIPQRAVSELPGLHQVMVVNPDNRIEVRTVTTGDRSGDLWIITSGLKVSERVVVDGLQKYQPGLQVIPQPDPNRGH